MIAKLLVLAGLLALAAAPEVRADDARYHGRVTSIPTNRKADDLYRVRIVSVNSEEPGMGGHVRVPVGMARVSVELIRNSGWTRKLPQVDEHPGAKTLEFEVKVGKTYEIAARVNTEADEAAQRDGSFWEPVVAGEMRAR